MQPGDRQDMGEAGGDEGAAFGGGMACSSPVSKVTAMAPVATGSVFRMRAAILLRRVCRALARVSGCAGAVMAMWPRAKPVAPNTTVAFLI
jgi:hypothetical protein